MCECVHARQERQELKIECVRVSLCVSGRRKNGDKDEGRGRASGRGGE